MTSSLAGILLRRRPTSKLRLVKASYRHVTAAASQDHSCQGALPAYYGGGGGLPDPLMARKNLPTHYGGGMLGYPSSRCLAGMSRRQWQTLKSSPGTETLATYCDKIPDLPGTRIYPAIYSDGGNSDTWILMPCFSSTVFSSSTSWRYDSAHSVLPICVPSSAQDPTSERCRFPIFPRILHICRR